jgi:hypothetical protein
MNRRLMLALAGIALLTLVPGLAVTGQGEEAMIFLPAGLQWKDGPPSLPPGAKFAVLEGDPSKEGPFAMRVKAPDGYVIPPHWHPKVERLTVIAGTFNLGMGEKFDPGALRPMPAGSYGYWPAGMRHFVRVKGETIVQLHGIGPWQITYVNPKDDPRNAARWRPRPAADSVAPDAGSLAHQALRLGR